MEVAVKTKLRALIVVAALLVSALACNLPFDSAEIFPSATPELAESTAPGSPAPATTQTSAGIGTQVAVTVEQPSAGAATSTPPPTVTAGVSQPSATLTRTGTQSASSTPPPTVTPRHTSTKTLTPTVTLTRTITRTPTITLTASRTVTLGASSTPPPTITTRPSSTATQTPTSTATRTSTATNIAGATSTTTPTPTVTHTSTTTPTPTVTYTSTTTPTGTAVQTNRTLAIANYFSTPPVLDGIWDEWADRSTEYPAAALVFGGANWTGPADLQASYRAAWDANYLYLAVKVHDDIYAQNATGANLYLGDSLEVLFDSNLLGDLNDHSLTEDDFQLGISPGLGSVDGAKEAYLWFPRSRMSAQSGVIVAAMRQDGITRVEAAIPWNVLGVVPAAGQSYGFAVSASDNDDTGQNLQQGMVSSVPTRVLVDPTTWGELQLK